MALYIPQPYPFGMDFLCQAGNFWTLLRTFLPPISLYLKRSHTKLTGFICLFVTTVIRSHSVFNTLCSKGTTHIYKCPLKRLLFSLHSATVLYLINKTAWTVLLIYRGVISFHFCCSSRIRDNKIHHGWMVKFRE